MAARWTPVPTGRGGWQLEDQHGIVLKRQYVRGGQICWWSWAFKTEEAAQRKADELNTAPVKEELWG